MQSGWDLKVKHYPRRTEGACGEPVIREADPAGTGWAGSFRELGKPERRGLKEPRRRAGLRPLPEDLDGPQAPQGVASEIKIRLDQSVHGTWGVRRNGRDTDAPSNDMSVSI